MSNNQPKITDPVDKVHQTLLELRQEDPDLYLRHLGDGCQKALLVSLRSDELESPFDENGELTFDKRRATQIVSGLYNMIGWICVSQHRGLDILVKKGEEYREMLDIKFPGADDERSHAFYQMRPTWQDAFDDFEILPEDWHVCTSDDDVVHALDLIVRECWHDVRAEADPDVVDMIDNSLTNQTTEECVEALKDAVRASVFIGNVSLKQDASTFELTDGETPLDLESGIAAGIFHIERCSNAEIHKQRNP